MKIVRNLFYCLLLSNIVSCSLLESKDKPQVFPDYNYSQIEKVILYCMESKEEIIIDDFSSIERVRKIFLNEGSYFKDELRKFNGVKPKFSLTLISLQDTIIFRVYPTNDHNKTELDFNEKYDSQYPLKSRKVHRFYMKKEIINFLDYVSKTR